MCIRDRGLGEADRVAGRQALRWGKADRVADRQALRWGEADRVAGRQALKWGEADKVADRQAGTETGRSRPDSRQTDRH